MSAKFKVIHLSLETSVVLNVQSGMINPLVYPHFVPTFVPLRAGFDQASVVDSSCVSNLNVLPSVACKSELSDSCAALRWRSPSTSWKSER